MKKIIVGAVAVITIGLGALFSSGVPEIDRMNPFLKEKEVYVLYKGDENSDPTMGGKKHIYELNGVDVSGEEKVIKVMMDPPKYLPKNDYLKVLVKGKSAMEVESVKEEAIPEKAKEKLKK
ncbi:YxeA family protein [Bacillus cereus]|uniref:YxeA family protein n=1 Tax=Bacillus cereus TaxID=1396 RepID=UPI003CE9C560